MTVKEINVFTGTIIDLVNTYNEARRIVLGVTRGNINIAFDRCERVESRIDTLITTLRQCNVFVINRYDISGLIYKIDVRYHDTQKEYKAKSNFRFMHD